MKSIVLYLTEYDIQDNNIKNEYWEKRSKELLDYKDGKFLFLSKFNPPEEINFIFQPILLDQELIDDISDKLLDTSLEIASKVSQEETMPEEINTKEGLDNIKQSIKMAVSSIINTFDYSENRTTFDFCARVFIKIINGHFLSNGNKRLALILTKNLLEELGWYWKWSKNNQYIQKDHYNENYQGKLEYFAEKLENNNGSDPKIINEIKEWIYKHVIINMIFWLGDKIWKTKKIKFSL